MKKKFMRIISMLMVLVMTLGMCVTSWAAGECSITIASPVGGETYSLYKVFDATYLNDGSVSYTIKSTDDWYELVSDEDSPFDLASGDEETYYVTLKSDASETDVAEWFNNLSSYPGTAVSSKTAEDENIVFDNLNAGYYLIVPGTGSDKVVTVTTAAPDTTVIDKNQTPGSDFAKTAVDAETGDSSYSIGDTVSYTIKSYVPTYNESYKVESYTFTDTMGAGLTLDVTSITVKISGTDFEETTLEGVATATPNSDGTTTITISYNIADITNYPADASIEISYSATVNASADETNVSNDVTMTWTEDGGNGPETPPTAGTSGYIFGFDLIKTDTNNTELQGAQFTLSQNGELISFVYDEEYNVYEKADGTEEEGSTTTTITVGDANIWGLGDGTYTLTEIMAPDGYNLAEPIEFTIAESKDSDGNVTGWVITSGSATLGSGSFSDEEEETDEHGIAEMAGISVIDNAGTTLPGTGGIGTTIFYVVGTLLVLAAAALVVAKMRLGKTE